MLSKEDYINILREQLGKTPVNYDLFYEAYNNVFGTNKRVERCYTCIKRMKKEIEIYLRDLK